MSFVVDTSVVLKWVVQEEDSARALTLVGRPLLAPGLVQLELANALWKKVRRGEIGADQAIRAFPTALSPVRLIPAAPLADRAFGLSLELDHPVYDCVFLVLARSLDFPLVTADKRLWTRTRATELESLVIHLHDWDGADDR